MRKTKHLLLWSSVGVLLLLIFAAFDENFLKEWRRLQGQASAQNAPIDVRLRQVVAPGLNVSDRCVSCHLGMGAGEEGVLGPGVVAPHKPIPHQPSEFGCTVCHGGQGRATEKSDAHGDVPFWPQPMLPARYSSAGCGTCHAPLGVPNLTALEKGRAVFERLDCLACHRLDGRGGTLRPGGGGMEGPNLSYTGFKAYDHLWYEKHTRHSEEAKYGPWKDSFGPISDSDRESLSVFLSLCIGAPGLIEGKALFHSVGCLGCHKVSGVGGDAGPDLFRSGERDPGQLDFTHVPGRPSLPNWLAEHFRSPAATVAGSQMPILGLAEDQIELLTLYVLSLRRRELPGAYLPKDRIQATRFGAREFAADGSTIFSAFCAGCHGTDGRGRRYPGTQPFPAITNPDFLSLASDEFIVQTVNKGRPGRKMLAWGEKDGGLRPDEVRAVVGYLRQLGGGVAPPPDPSPARWVKGDIAAGSQIFAAFCAGCHGKNGDGGEGPALNNKVFLSAATDKFLVETISKGRRATAMAGFSSPSPVRPALTQSEIESLVAFMRSWEAK
ncbi:MAG TPA: c-type cytochrome [Blastocatellia bacterium]|nr:c-type cytochrome [Blastocatellia bacterium]